MPLWAGKLRTITVIIATASFLILGAAAAGLSQFIARNEQNSIALVAQDTALSLNRLFGNVVWPNYADFVAEAHRLDATAIGAHPLIRALEGDAGRLTRDTKILKFKLYDLQGLTVFSSRTEEIGSNKYSSPGLQAALAGQVTSVLEQRARFAAARGDLADVVIVQSYLPIRRDETEPVLAVLEVYTDVTATYRTVSANVRLAEIAIVITFAIAFLLIVAVAGYAEREIERRRRENTALAEAKQRAELANRTKSLFLANMSHEFRTPLNAIVGFTEMIERQYIGPIGESRYVAYAGNVLQAARHLIRIVDDVLDLSRIEAGKMPVDPVLLDPADAARAAADMLRREAEAAGLRLDCATAANLPRLAADPGKLQQILLNLLGNAIKFTPAGGAVSLGVTAADGAAVFEVRDSGIGIRREDIAKVLTLFGQVDHPFIRKAGGTGLGLPLARQLAELMGGDLEIESEPGRGTVVRVRLPLATAWQTLGTQTPPQKRPANAP